MGEEALELTRDQLAELKKRFFREMKPKEESGVRISNDGMEAWMYLAEPGGDKEGYSKEELIGMLREAGVATGYIMPRLVAMSRKGVYQREILVAKGKPAVDGTDGAYEYFFAPDDISKAPKIKEDGSVDYTSMSMLQNVKTGDKLAVYHPAIPGQDGFTVDGEILKCNVVKELPPIRGMCIRREGNTYYANTTGKVELKDGTIDIKAVHEVSGDVDLSIGKIEFFGDVVISGNVTAGVMIRAGRNLVINGNVESATLYAGGDIVLKRGVQGNMKGKIRARGSVFSNFIEQCEVRAEGNVEANYILNANVYASNKVIVSGSRGSIIGGYTFGLKGIEVGQLGNDVEVRTVVHAGYERETYNEWCKCQEEERDIADKLEQILYKMEALIKKKNFAGSGAGQGLVELNTQKDICYKKLDEVKEKKQKYKQRIDEGKGSKITVFRETYRGVVLELESCSRTMNSEVQYAVYRCLKGSVEIESAG